MYIYIEQILYIQHIQFIQDYRNTISRNKLFYKKSVYQDFEHDPQVGKDRDMETDHCFHSNRRDTIIDDKSIKEGHIKLIFKIWLTSDASTLHTTRVR